MNYMKFKEWLKKAKYKDTVINSRISNCNRICNYEGDIDDLFNKDKCKDLLKRLSYTKEDKIYHNKPKHRIPIKGDVYNGTATLRSALNLYIEFRSQGQSPIIKDKKEKIINSKQKKDWPTWNAPTEDDCLLLAKTTTKYIRFLSPEIIEEIVKSNEEDKDWFCDYLKKSKIDVDLYLWNKTSCCFPGIRRHAGSSEIAAHRKRSSINTIEDAIALDDNDFPKQIWSFIFRGAQFGKFGPNGYNLAHLVDHKKDKNRMPNEFTFEKGHVFNKPFYGLYTCASNSVYIPDKLMKPTDFNGAIRNLLFRKAKSLYSKCCNLVPPYVKSNDSYGEKWDLNNFEWADPVGTLDNIKLFLDFRKKKIEDLLKKK